MRVRCVLSLLLLFLPIAVAAQDLDTALAAVVRITGTRNGNPVRGSGFVVALSPGAATIVTASHVIEGAQFEVVFSSTTDPFGPDGAVLGMESGNPNGLAVFQVHGAIPVGVEMLPIDAENRPRPGESLFLVGFPQRSPVPVVKQGILSTRRGILLLVDRPAGEGASGGPLIRDGKAVGVITSADEQFTVAVNAVIVREALDGWGVKITGGVVGELEPAREEKEGLCRPGEEEMADNGIVFVRICAGTFTMGSADDDPLADDDEKPAHKVTLSEFWIGRFEVTNDEFRRLHPDHGGEDKLPAAPVTWSNAQGFCEHYGFRLPTEAEWEYAARAGTQTLWSFGDEKSALTHHAWYDGNSGKAPQPVGRKEPNPWGLYDMHGNVWEWVADWYGPYSPRPETDPTGPSPGALRVVRGGSFLFAPRRLRSANRLRNHPVDRSRYLGFRCVRRPRKEGSGGPGALLPFQGSSSGGRVSLHVQDQRQRPGHLPDLPQGDGGLPPTAE